MSQPHPSPQRWPAFAPWTLSLSVLLVLLNLGLFFEDWANAQLLLTALQYDGVAIRQDGDLYRLLTANLVHWSRVHFYFDGVAFLVWGLLYERYFGRAYPWLLLWTGLVVSLAGLAYWPAQTLCRGLSGVNAGQVAALLCLEFRLAWRDPGRWVWVAPGTALFVFWLGYELVTGQPLFIPGGGGEVSILAHLAGTVGALTFILALALWKGGAKTGSGPS